MRLTIVLLYYQEQFLGLLEHCRQNKTWNYNNDCSVCYIFHVEWQKKEEKKRNKGDYNINTKHFLVRSYWLQNKKKFPIFILQPKHMSMEVHSISFRYCVFRLTLSRVQECTSFHTSGSFLVTNIKIRSPCLLPPFIKVTVFSHTVTKNIILIRFLANIWI